MVPLDVRNYAFWSLHEPPVDDLLGRRRPATSLRANTVTSSEIDGRSKRGSVATQGYTPESPTLARVETCCMAELAPSCKRLAKSDLTAARAVLRSSPTDR